MVTACPSFTLHTAVPCCWCGGAGRQTATEATMKGEATKANEATVDMRAETKAARVARLQDGRQHEQRREQRRERKEVWQ